MPVDPVDPDTLSLSEFLAKVKELATGAETPQKVDDRVFDYFDPTKITCWTTRKEGTLYKILVSKDRAHKPVLMEVETDPTKIVRDYLARDKSPG